MTKRRAEDYGSSRPKLSQEDFDGDFIILTIATCDEIEVDDEEKQGGKRRSLVLTFAETGDKAIWLNVSQTKAIIEKFGDDDAAWIGQMVPVEKYTATFGTKMYPKVRIMAAEEWEQAFEDAGVKAKPKAAARKAVVKGTARKKVAAARARRAARR